MSTIQEGAAAPDFALEDQEGKTHNLKDYRGKWVVLYAYPKDDTPGCTAQACGFRDRRDEFGKRDAVVLGLSILDPKSKARFAKKHSLNFTLLSDPDHLVAEKYGVWREKSRYGRKYMGIERETFIIDPKGKLARHIPKAKGNEAHSDEVLKVLDELR